MSDMTAEKLIQRAYDVGLIDGHQMDRVWSDVGSRDASLDAVVSTLLRKEVLTNYQIDRIMRGERMGFFYGKYRTLYLVGAGTFARVYRSVHESQDKVFAVKVLRKRYRDSIAEVETFLREGRVGLELRHPNVVPIYEIEGDPRNPFMVMEFVEGQTLRDMVRVRGPLPVKVAMSLLCDIVAGLNYAADKGISHRDLKMSNVLVTSTGRAKLVDFGLASHTEGDKVIDSPNARAIDYAALERGTGVRKDDRRSDLYFAGCLMYNMVTGKPPLFETKDRLQRLSISRFHNIEPVHQLAPNLPPLVTGLITRAMDLDPEKRFPSAADMLRECRAIEARVESGATSAAVSDKDAPEAIGEQPIAKALEGEGRTVLVVESKVEMQDVLRDLLKKRGYRVLIMRDPKRAEQRLLDAPKVADVLLFSTTGLGEAGIEAFNKFATERTTEEVPSVLLLGEDEKPQANSAKVDAKHVMLRMPLRVRQLRSALLQLIRAADAKAR